jgi:quinol monooxygenase YgiN
LVLARIAKFSFKKGKREEAFAELDLTLNMQVRNAKGFRGFISMISEDAKNEATIITLWEDQISLVSSENELLSVAVKKILNSLEKEPAVEHLKIFSTEMFMQSPS